MTICTIVPVPKKVLNMSKERVLLPNTNSTKRAVTDSTDDDDDFLQVQSKLNASLSDFANESQEPIKKAPGQTSSTKRQRTE
jgi:hypothetical protein